LLRAAVGSRFTLFTEAQTVEHLHPLGTVDELLRRAREQAGAPSRPTNGVRKTAPPPPLPKPRQPQARILEGSLEEFELAHVLQVLSTSRQQFELHVRDDVAASSGVIEVKSSMVVAASTEKLSGVPAARELLAARSGRFVAIRRAEVSTPRQPLISVQELLLSRAAQPDAPFALSHALGLTGADDAREEEDELAVPIPVLDGKLGDLDVASILHVAGASRQYTTVHIIDDQRRPLGAIHLKGSHVVSAQAQDVKGIAAVRRLLHSPRDFSFLVQRYPHAPELTTSLGSTASVLQRAAALSEPGYTPIGISAPPPPPPRVAPVNSSSSSNWIAGALVGAGFVLLGGIGTAVVLRSPVLNATTSMSPSSDPSQVAPRLAPPPSAAEPESTPAQAPAHATEASQSSAPSSRAAIASFQAGLRQLGYDPGPIDGVIGPHTSAAIKAFQYAEHLTADGNLSAPTRAVLLRRIGEP
jgi:hypothetical protein